MATPTPNPGSEKRSKESAGWVTLPADGPDGDPPELDGAYGPDGDRLWARWWSTPMALMWSEDDAVALERLLVMSLSFRAGESTAAMWSEIRQLEDRFGLNPKARKQLYWRIEGVDVPATDATSLGTGETSALPAAGGDSDPRRGLRSVG